MIILVILAYAVIVALELVPLIRKKKSKEAILYSAILLPAFVVSILLSLGVEIPSVALPIEKGVKSLLGLER